MRNMVVNWVTVWYLSKGVVQTGWGPLVVRETGSGGFWTYMKLQEPPGLTDSSAIIPSSHLLMWWHPPASFINFNMWFMQQEFHRIIANFVHWITLRGKIDYKALTAITFSFACGVLWGDFSASICLLPQQCTVSVILLFFFLLCVFRHWYLNVLHIWWNSLQK